MCVCLAPTPSGDVGSVHIFRFLVWRLAHVHGPDGFAKNMPAFLFFRRFFFSLTRRCVLFVLAIMTPAVLASFLFRLLARDSKKSKKGYTLGKARLFPANGLILSETSIFVALLGRKRCNAPHHQENLDTFDLTPTTNTDVLLLFFSQNWLLGLPSILTAVRYVRERF